MATWRAMALQTLQGVQGAVPDALQVLPATQDGTAQAGTAPPVQAQVPSASFLASVPPAPVAETAQEKTYEFAPTVGASGTTSALAKAPSGGCESATTSAVESARE